MSRLMVTFSLSSILILLNFINKSIDKQLNQKMQTDHISLSQAKNIPSKSPYQTSPSSFFNETKLNFNQASTEQKLKLIQEVKEIQMNGPDKFNILVELTHSLHTKNRVLDKELVSYQLLSAIAFEVKNKRPASEALSKDQINKLSVIDESSKTYLADLIPELAMRLLKTN